MRYVGSLGVSLLIILSLFLVTGICAAREMTVLIKCDFKKVQLSALRPDGTVIAETKKPEIKAG
jgi:hypothetical protein